ncbi:MAG: glycosyltransferase family 4 protein, partial [Planctomycetota bacterium]
FAPEIIHTHHGWVIASILAEFSVPYLISLHGTEYFAFKNYKDYQQATLRGIHSAQIIIALTEQEKTQAVSAYSIDPQKITVVTSGTDTNMFKPLVIDKRELLKSYSVKQLNRPVVFLGGRLTAQKGVDTLLRAAEIYSKTEEMPITLIAGDGDLRDQLEALARKLQLDTVYFIGNQNHRQMVKLYNIADVIAMPSIFEAFGLVATEALACGTPVIASNVGGCKEIVTEQVGCLIEPSDYKTLAEKVITFIKDGFKEKARDKIAAYARQNFSWEKK